MNGATRSLHVAAIVLALTLGVRAQPAPIFAFHTDELWLNLHQFLYVLGRQEARMADRTRRAVAAAPADQQSGLTALTVDEADAWHDAVHAYAIGPSRRDAVFDPGLIEIESVLAGLPADVSPTSTRIDPAIAAVLTRAGPLYRKAWWPVHQRANQQWSDRVGRLVQTHGRAVLSFITRAYELPWPAAGFPVHVCGYANWAGAFSTGDNLLVISSLDSGNTGLSAMETAFHEAMHQWDTAVGEALLAEALKQGLEPHPDLSHGLIFYTAGAAVRSISPDYVGYADANGLWTRHGLAEVKPALDAAWRPHLDGRGSRTDAFAEVIGELARR